MIKFKTNKTKGGLSELKSEFEWTEQFEIK
jgi:hypothetical protein